MLRLYIGIRNLNLKRKPEKNGKAVNKMPFFLKITIKMRVIYLYTAKFDSDTLIKTM